MLIVVKTFPKKSAFLRTVKSVFWGLVGDIGDFEGSRQVRNITGKILEVLLWSKSELVAPGYGQKNA